MDDVHSFIVSANPRLVGTCERCGLPKDHGRHAMPEHLRRNADWEGAFLESLAYEVANRVGADIEPFVLTVKERLENGREKYGDRVGRDLFAELLEETPDIVGYTLLELQNVGEPPDDVHRFLFEACIHAAIADDFVRAARTARRVG